MMQSHYEESELKSWLETTLKKEQLSDIVIENFSYAAKGEGAIGDIVFVDARAKDPNGSIKTFNFALKCSKDSSIVRENSPSQAMFMNEMNFYEDVMSAFTRFQTDRGIKEPFDSIPKYYGSILSENREVMVFENLSKNGYVLWDRQEPMTRKHIDLLIEQYAKFHAISVAMQDQEPELFEALLQPLTKLFDAFEKYSQNVVVGFFNAIKEVHDLLQDELEPHILLPWKNFHDYIQVSTFERIRDFTGMKVINHGDCWNNNFMFQNEQNHKLLPRRVTILDWQVAKSGPIASDLAHFLFSCVAEKDLEDMQSILNEYYNHFSDYLIKLKSDVSFYTRENFFQDWKDHSRWGIMMVPIAMKICTREKEEAVDILEAAEKGDFAQAFSFEIKDKDRLKKRMKPLVKYIVQNNLI